MYRVEDFAVRTYIRNRCPFEGYRATCSSRVPLGWGVANFRTSPYRLSRKFAVTKARATRRGSTSRCSSAALHRPRTLNIDTSVTAKCGKRLRLATYGLSENLASTSFGE